MVGPAYPLYAQFVSAGDEQLMTGDGSTQPLSGLLAYVCDLRKLNPGVLRRGENGSGQWMLRVTLQTCHQCQHFSLLETTDTRDRHRLHHNWHRAEDGGRDCHQARADTLEAGFDAGNCDLGDFNKILMAVWPSISRCHPGFRIFNRARNWALPQVKPIGPKKFGTFGE